MTKGALVLSLIVALAGAPASTLASPATVRRSIATGLGKLPGARSIRLRLKARAERKQQEKVQALRRAWAIVETAEGAATWAPPGQLATATRQVLERTNGGWKQARRDLRRAIGWRGDPGFDAATRWFDARVEAALARPEAAEVPRASEGARRAAPIPERFRQAPWRLPSPRRGSYPWSRNSGGFLREYGYREDLAHTAHLTAELGVRHRVALARSFTLDVAGIMKEVMDVGVSATMYQHQFLGRITDPTRNNGHDKNDELLVLGDGISSTLVSSQWGPSIKAGRYDIDGKSYEIEVLTEFMKPDGLTPAIPYAGRKYRPIGKLQVSRTRTIPVRGGRDWIVTTVATETVQPDGRHRITESKTEQFVDAEGDIAERTTPLRDELVVPGPPRPALGDGRQSSDRQ